MTGIIARAKTQTRRVVLAATGLLMGVATLGMSAASSVSADSYSNYNNYGYGGYNNYSYNQHGYGYMTGYHQQNHYYRAYSTYRWVYDPFLHRWVLIGYNVYLHRWELVNSYDRWCSHQNNRWDRSNGSYWYND